MFIIKELQVLSDEVRIHDKELEGELDRVIHRERRDSTGFYQV